MTIDLQPIQVIGGGLAGTEAAWQIAAAQVLRLARNASAASVSRAPHRRTRRTGVRSNSFGAASSDRAAGLLHQELRQLGSIVIGKADEHNVPAGGALTVDRAVFSHDLTETLSQHPLITLSRQEVKEIPSDGIVVLTTGPLTSHDLAQDLLRFTGMEYLSFFDAASPIVVGESIDMDVAFRASRYDKGDADYINCPMNKEQYLQFWNALCNAEQAELKDFERETAKFFEGCLPIEEMAKRGEETMRYGPLKPVGLTDDRTGERFYAVVQLRQEDKAGQLWNMVGFQTNLRWGEQKRVFRLIPGLENAEFVRMGVMHRNTFINSPKLLQPTLQFQHRPTVLAAGQLTGTESYTAATAGGWLAGTNAARLALGLSPIQLPVTTMLGALIDFITSASAKHFQPMPPNFGIIPPFPVKIRDKRERYGAYRDRSLADLATWRTQIDNQPKIS